MKRSVWIIGLLLPVLILGIATADWQAYKEMFMAGQYETLAQQCDATEAEISADPGNYIIYKYCGLAKLKLYEQKRSATDLTDAIDYLERSIAFSYSEEAAFHLGQARMMSLDQLTEGENQDERELAAINEMWESIRNLHAMENFNREVLSDGMLIWTRDYRDLLIERILKDEDNPARLHLLTAKVRMLADRYERVDPTKGESEVRQSNLRIFKDWMDELMRMSYFDNDIVVGMYKYKADRHMEKYNQTAETEDQFTKALHGYGEALKRAKTNLARAALYTDIAYLCSLYNSEDKEKLVAYYKTGFNHAHQGLLILKQIKENEQNTGEEFPYPPDMTELTSKVQKAYGSNLTGLCYFHYLRKDYRSAVAMRNFAFDTGFDWDGKVTTLLLIADAADKLASEHHRVPKMFRTYKQVCLFASSRAFKTVLKNHNGRIPQNSEEFCRVYNNYINYLRRFGETIEARNLELQFGAVCPQE